MAKTITISLPDDLYEKLQEYKSRIKVSAACQQAIINQIRLLETMKGSDLVGFLKASKREYHSSDRAEGANQARVYINSNQVDYSNFIEADKLLEAKDIGDISWDDVADLLDRGKGGATTDILGEAYASISDQTDRHIDPDMFAQGFINEAVRVWEKIREEL